jgi:hypothetical protein
MFSHDELAARLGRVSHFQRLPAESLRTIIDASLVGLARGRAWSYRGALITLGAIAVLAIAPIAVSRALRGKSMPSELSPNPKRCLSESLCQQTL